MRVYSVTEFRQEMNQVFGEFTVAIAGEVTGFHVSRNRFVWFSLADDSTVIDCFMLNFQLKEQLEDGMQIKVVGSPTLFKKGKFVFRPRRIELLGDGSLRADYERLHKQLQAEGLFDEDRKRSLPRFPQQLGLVTSGDAAAYSDVLRILKNRWAELDIIHADVTVQGSQAPQSIIDAVEQLNHDYPAMDCLIVTRGGGSLEDLQAFNDEQVVRAVFASKIPVVSAVGHERDITLCDLVADVRASTPSNAAELVVPDKRDVANELDYMVDRLEQQLRRQLRQQIERIDRAVHSLDRQARQQITQFTALDQRLRFAFENFQAMVAAKQQQISGFERLLQSLHPDRVLERGFTLTLDTAGRVLTSAKRLKPGATLTTRFSDGAVASRIVDKSNQ